VRFEKRPGCGLRPCDFRFFRYTNVSAATAGILFAPPAARVLPLPSHSATSSYSDALVNHPLLAAAAVVVVVVVVVSSSGSDGGGDTNTDVGPIALPLRSTYGEPWRFRDGSFVFLSFLRDLAAVSPLFETCCFLVRYLDIAISRFLFPLAERIARSIRAEFH